LNCKREEKLIFIYVMKHRSCREQASGGNRELRGIFVPKRREEAGDWRKLCNELHNLYSSPDMLKSRKTKWAGHVARKVKRTEVHTGL
jgi:hypothetical protein